MANANTQTDRDQLVVAATAFRSFEQLQKSVENHGYFPTLCRGNSAQLRLGRYLESIQIRVFWVGKAARRAA